MAAVNINAKQYEELILGKKAVLVDFWAPWCTYCRRINPALDKIVYLEKLKMGEVNPIEIKETLAAGKGVDVSKVLRALGHPVTACGFLGNNHAAIFERLCITCSINDRFTRIQGQTRTNIHILDADGHETELLEPAPTISPREWKDFMERLGQI